MVKQVLYIYKIQRRKKKKRKRKRKRKQICWVERGKRKVLKFISWLWWCVLFIWIFNPSVWFPRNLRKRKRSEPLKTMWLAVVVSWRPWRSVGERWWEVSEQNKNPNFQSKIKILKTQIFRNLVRGFGKERQSKHILSFLSWSNT